MTDRLERLERHLDNMLAGPRRLMRSLSKTTTGNDAMTEQDRKLISSLQSMRDRLMSFLGGKYGDAFDGDMDILLEAINRLKRGATVRRTEQGNAMNITTEVVAALAELKVLVDSDALERVYARIESALTKAEAVAYREFSAWVGDMKTSAGMDYYVCVGHGKAFGEYMTPNAYKIRGRAEYDVACWNRLFGLCDEPDIIAFDTDAPPAVPVESLGRDADYPDCSGDPASCPENEGYGCCKPNPVKPVASVQDGMVAILEIGPAGNRGWNTTAKGRQLPEGEYPLYLSAQPEATRNAKDAARFRWLRDQAINTEGAKGSPWCVYGMHLGDCTPTFGAELVAFVDDAMANGIVCSPTPTTNQEGAAP